MQFRMASNSLFAAALAASVVACSGGETSTADTTAMGSATTPAGTMTDSGMAVGTGTGVGSAPTPAPPVVASGTAARQHRPGGPAASSGPNPYGIHAAGAAAR